MDGRNVVADGLAVELIATDEPRLRDGTYSAEPKQQGTTVINKLEH